MVAKLRGDLVVKPDQHFAIVVAQFNSAITERLADGAVDAFLRHGAQESQLRLVHVPGSFEIATAAMALAKSGHVAAVVCVGCVIRGETSHFDHVANQVSAGVAAVSRETGVPTIFSVVTTDTVEQAMDRAGLKMGNAGWSGACAAIEMANLMARLRQALA